MVENVVRGVERDPGSWRGLPVHVLHKPTASPSTSQRVSRCHEAPGSGHGDAAPGSLQLARADLPEAVWTGPLLQPQEGDGGAGGRWTLELGEGCFPFHLYRGAGQTAAGAEEHKAGAGPWAGAGTDTGARKLQGTGGDHSRLSGRGEERLAAGERWMGTLDLNTSALKLLESTHAF